MIVASTAERPDPAPPLWALDSGGSRRAAARERLLSRLRTSLEGTGYEVFGDEVWLRVGPTGLYTFPDIAVVRGEPRFEDGSPKALRNPIAILEIVPGATLSCRNNGRVQHFCSIESLDEYVEVAIDRLEFHYTRRRRRSDGVWDCLEVLSGDATIELSSVGVTIGLAGLLGAVLNRPSL